MTRSGPFYGPRIIVGAFAGAVLGLLALFNLMLALSAILVTAYVLGSRQLARQPHGGFLAHVPLGDTAYWRQFPLATFPGQDGEGRHTDRPFVAFSECEYGHVDVHSMGEPFTHDGQRRISRRCVNYPGCPSLWSELA